MHELYRERYLQSRIRAAYYDVPIIVLSSISSVFIAGGESYVSKNVVQISTCIMSLLTGVIGALKKFFRVDENREQCLETYKDLFRMFCELSIMLDMPEGARPGDPQQYSTESANKYAEIMQRAMVLEHGRVRKNPIYNDSNPMDVEKRKGILERMISRTRSNSPQATTSVRDNVDIVP
jgi:hypothetical protein